MVDGTPEYHAAPGEANDVQLSDSNGTWTISDQGAVLVAGAGCTQINDHEATCSGGAMDLFLGDENDIAEMTSGVSFGTQVHGEEGNDQLSNCSQCDADLLAGPGDDLLQAGDVGGEYRGAEGTDTLVGAPAATL